MLNEYWWWIVAALLIAIEVASGTFYLMLYGVAAAVAGLAAWLGADVVVQLLIAALIGVSGTWALRRWKRDRPDLAPTSMEIGHAVRLETWAEGHGQVIYRGAVWDAEAESASVDSTRPLFIRAVNGNILIVGNQP
jgi:membrane protein implicated in regulation of membrane protease activity